VFLLCFFCFFSFIIFHFSTKTRQHSKNKIVRIVANFQGDPLRGFGERSILPQSLVI